jgi:hypothetical protein
MAPQTLWARSEEEKAAMLAEYLATVLHHMMTLLTKK